MRGPKPDQPYSALCRGRHQKSSLAETGYQQVRLVFVYVRVRVAIRALCAAPRETWVTHTHTHE